MVSLTLPTPNTRHEGPMTSGLPLKGKNREHFRELENNLNVKLNTSYFVISKNYIYK